ncbi:MAG TPA: cupin domain-containing protein [Rhizomicrobium sp.]|jgi:mannose-6-phosphate isomerase-like protein (cupin superfamily)
MTPPVKFGLAEAAQALAKAPDNFITVATQGEMRLLLFAPQGTDTQTPHTQDEVYVVVSGHGTFRRGGDTVNFTSGDMLFVGAGVEHRFETFSDDFKTWVVFFGPKGSSAA